MISPTAGDIGIWTRTMLIHTYTRTPVSAGAEDAWGEVTATPGTAVTGQPCLYRERDQTTVGPEGRVMASAPTMYVGPSDPLAVGDRVSAIKDRNGVSVQVGPLTVQSIEDEDGLGPIVLRRAVLKAGDVV